MKLRITLILAALTLPALTASAQQDQAAKEQAFRKPCAADIDKLCKEEDKKNQTVECLAAHEKDLSDDCSLGFMNRYRAAQICKADFERLCKDVRPLGPCVQAHDAELSKECKAALVKGSKQQKADEKTADKQEKVAEPAAAAKPAKSAKKSTKKK